MRVVTPFRPFAPESHAHRLLGPFDWIGAMRMLRTSVSLACDCDTVAITDVDTDLPVPSFQFHTVERRLMLWILEVSRAYLASDLFNCNTVMVSPDMLVYGPLEPYFTADLGILVRTGKFAQKRPVLNSVQWWAPAAKDRLVAWYDDALAYAKHLQEDSIVWGADTEPFEHLLAPLERECIAMRGNLSVAFLPCESIVEAMQTSDATRLHAERPIVPSCAVVDFRYGRKRLMADYFDATIGQVVRP